MEQAMTETEANRITWRGVLDELWPLLDKLSVKAYIVFVSSSWEELEVTDERLTLDGEVSSTDVLHVLHSTEISTGSVHNVVSSFISDLIDDNMSHFRSEDGNSEFGKVLLLPGERTVKITWTITHQAEQEVPTKTFDFTPPIMMQVADALGQDGEK